MQRILNVYYVILRRDSLTTAASSVLLLPPVGPEPSVEEREVRILPVVLYVCGSWSLTLREEHGLRVLRRIFGPKRDEVMGG
jgi:hypothetical protein